MEIKFSCKEKKISLTYDDYGVLEYVTDITKDKKMMVEYTQFGNGYEMSDHNGYVPMKMCNAVYVRIMELDVFVPKFIFIPNNNSEE